MLYKELMTLTNKSNYARGGARVRLTYPKL